VCASPEFSYFISDNPTSGELKIRFVNAAAFLGSNHMAILSEKQVEQQLSKLHDWALEGRAIRKQFTFNDFPAAVAFVNRLVPEAQLEKAVNDLIARITSHSGPVLTMAKKAILSGMGLSLKEGLKQSMNIFLNELYRLEDSQEGLHALVEKRKPNWKNR